MDLFAVHGFQETSSLCLSRRWYWLITALCRKTANDYHKLSPTLSGTASQSREAKDSRVPWKWLWPSREVSRRACMGPFSSEAPLPPEPSASVPPTPLDFMSLLRNSWYFGFWLGIEARGVKGSSSVGLSGCLLESISDSWRRSAEELWSHGINLCES